jgi:hypothetical protein
MACATHAVADHQSKIDTGESGGPRYFRHCRSVDNCYDDLITTAAIVSPATINPQNLTTGVVAVLLFIPRCSNEVTGMVDGGRLTLIRPAVGPVGGFMCGIRCLRRHWCDSFFAKQPCGAKRCVTQVLASSAVGNRSFITIQNRPS